MSNPGSDKLQMVASLTNKIRMDDPCNIQFTSGEIRLKCSESLSHLVAFQELLVSQKVSLCPIITLSTTQIRLVTGSATVTK